HPLRGPARAAGRRGAAGRRPGLDPGRRGRPRARRRRRAPTARGARPLPAARDRVRAVPAPHPARRAGRPGGRKRALRERDADRRAADRGAGAAGRAHLDRDQGAGVTELDFDETLEQQGEIEIPSTLPVLPLKETVIFPQSVSPLAIGQERSVKLVDDVLEGERMLALVTVKDTEADEPGWDDLYDVGTAAVVHKMIR